MEAILRLSFSQIIIEVSQPEAENRSGRDCLLLDRETRRLYLGEEETVKSHLEEPETLVLLAALDPSEAMPKRDKKAGLLDQEL